MSPVSDLLNETGKDCVAKKLKSEKKVNKNFAVLLQSNSQCLSQPENLALNLRPTSSKKRDSKRKNRKRGKSDLSYVSSCKSEGIINEKFNLPTKETSNEATEKISTANDEKLKCNSDECKSTKSSEEKTFEKNVSETYELYDDFYKNVGLLRQDSFSNDSAVGTMKSDFFADIDFATLRDGSDVLDFNVSSEKKCSTPSRADSPVESTAL